MLGSGSATVLTLLTVISLQELLSLAAPAIENAAYTSQDLWADESAVHPAVELAPLKRHRRYDTDFSGESRHCGHRHHKRGGHDHRRGHGHGHGHGFGHHPDNFGFGFGPGHGHPPPPPPPHGFGFGPYPGPGRFNPGPPYKTPLEPFQDDNDSSQEESKTPATPSKATTLAASTTSSTTSSTTTTTTEDPTLGIDIRIGS